MIGEAAVRLSLHGDYSYDSCIRPWRSCNADCVIMKLSRTKGPTGVTGVR